MLTYHVRLSTWWITHPRIPNRWRLASFEKMSLNALVATVVLNSINLKKLVHVKQFFCTLIDVHNFFTPHGLGPPRLAISPRTLAKTHRIDKVQSKAFECYSKKTLPIISSTCSELHEDEYAFIVKLFRRLMKQSFHFPGGLHPRPSSTLIISVLSALSNFLNNFSNICSCQSKLSDVILVASPIFVPLLPG